MSNISVALSSMRHCVAASYPINEDTPVCVVFQSLLMFGGLNNEHLEHQFCEIARKMARVVSVDPDKKTVFVGVDADDEESGLVVYQELNENNDFARSFFEQWRVLKKMLFEFQVFGNNKDCRYVIRGLWVEDHWESLDSIPFPKTIIITESG